MSQKVSANLYWDAPPDSFVRKSKGMAIFQLSTPVAPQVEKAPTSKKGRPPADGESQEPAEKKKSRKNGSPQKRDDGDKPKKPRKSTKSKPSADGDRPTKKLITIQRNVYYRAKHTVTADEAPVCECRHDVTPACGQQCVNRILFIECHPKYCPTGGLCTNQRFQSRQYAPLRRVPCGPKGHGVTCEKDLEAGEFVMEYCGEVITIDECMRRLRQSREKGETNFYILTLTAQECVDAARRGNLARFINHSCEPNCETQKWQVAGEVCVGLFARKFIRAGTELTFDYQFERVGGDKQKCYCGSATCRGYLGAKKSEYKQREKRERKARERDLEFKGRVKHLYTFEQLVDLVDDDEPTRPPGRVFLLRNARSGYRRWERAVEKYMPSKEKYTHSHEKDMSLERALKKNIRDFLKENPNINLIS